MNEFVSNSQSINEFVFNSQSINEFVFNSQSIDEFVFNLQSINEFVFIYKSINEFAFICSLLIAMDFLSFVLLQSINDLVFNCRSVYLHSQSVNQFIVFITQACITNTIQYNTENLYGGKNLQESRALWCIKTKSFGDVKSD